MGILDGFMVLLCVYYAVIRCLLIMVLVVSRGLLGVYYDVPV